MTGDVQHLRPAEQLDPGQTVPIILVVIDGHRRLRSPAQESDPGGRSLGALGLLIDGAPHGVLESHEGDGQDAGVALVVEQSEAGHGLGLD